MKALIIDDDEIARELLASTLESAGFQVFELPSPIGATKVLLDHRVDGVVLDVMMPGLNGDKLAKLLRANGTLQTLGIVLVSSLDPATLIQLKARSTANAVVQKSNIRTHLGAALKKAIHEARTERARASM